MSQIVDTLDVIEHRFDSVWMDDHFIPWASFVPADTETLECLTTLAYLARAYPALDFGCSVLCQSFRHPALMAKMGANLQFLTGGRFILGAGAGWLAREYEAYGYGFPKASVRIAQLDEWVQIVRKMWTQAPASFTGRYYRIDDAYCEPRPDPVPPILIGGGGERLTLRVVARQADWWNIQGGTAENYAHKLEVLRGHCEAVGRDYDEIVKTWSAEVVAIAETATEARRVANASPYTDSNPIVGTPDEVTSELRGFVDLGVRHLIVRFVDFPTTGGAELFAEAVMPNLS